MLDKEFTTIEEAGNHAEGYTLRHTGTKHAPSSLQVSNSNSKPFDSSHNRRKSSKHSFMGSTRGKGSGTQTHVPPKGAHVFPVHALIVTNLAIRRIIVSRDLEFMRKISQSWQLLRKLRQ